MTFQPCAIALINTNFQVEALAQLISEPIKMLSMRLRQKGTTRQRASLGYNDSSISKIVGTRTQRERGRGTDMHTHRRSLQEGGTNWKE